MGNIVWLKNNISITAWDTASNWAFWNEQTQQIEDYGQAPNGDDYVYLNSYIVSVFSNSTLSFPNGTITNKPNPYTNLEDGRFDNGSNGSQCQIISNIEVGNSYILRHSGNGVFTYNITGNITGSDTAVVCNKGGNNTIVLNVIGNIYGGSQPLMSGNTGSSLSVIGDVYLKNGVGSNVTSTLKINGSLHLDYTTFTSTTVGTLDTEGDIYLTGKKLGSCTNWINRGASIYYKGLNPLGGFCNYTNLDLRYPDDFVVKDIDEPRVNPLVIETNWDFANEVQYPNENRVVAGTPYAFDQKVGTFGVDYPPETVVLNDYVYDNGEMVGTLDLPQAPTTSDIVTAIKNDSDLGGKINTTNTNVGNISTAVTTIDGKVDIIDTNVDTLLSRLTSVLTQRLGQSVTVEILQQILIAHLGN